MAIKKKFKEQINIIRIITYEQYQSKNVHVKELFVLFYVFI